MDIKNKIVQNSQWREDDGLKQVLQFLSHEERRLLYLAGEKGALSWLIVLPIREFGFALHRRHFIDSICLHYGWDLKDVPLHCDCGSKFSVEHALSCLKGGFVNGRH